MRLQGAACNLFSLDTINVSNKAIKPEMNHNILDNVFDSSASWNLLPDIKMICPDGKPPRAASELEHRSHCMDESWPRVDRDIYQQDVWWSWMGSYNVKEQAVGDFTGQLL